MWSEKDALNGVLPYFCKDESCIFICKPCRFYGMSPRFIICVCIYLSVCNVVLHLDQLQTPLCLFIVFAVSVLIIRHFLYRCICRNHILITQNAIYRYIHLSNAHVVQSRWEDVSDVTLRKMRLFPSHVCVKIHCKKERIPKKRILPRKLIRFRFGKLKIARIRIDRSFIRPVNQQFAVKSEAEFMQILRELQTFPKNSFIIRYKGDWHECFES